MENKKENERSPLHEKSSALRLKTKSLELAAVAAAAATVLTAKQRRRSKSSVRRTSSNSSRSRIIKTFFLNAYAGIKIVIVAKLFLFNAKF